MAITDPLDISDCVLWLDATDNSKYTYYHMDAGDKAIVDSWGTGQNKPNPYLLNSWVDKSTGGNDVVTAGGEFRPKVKVNDGINGLNSVDFDGYDFLSIPDDIITFGNFSIFIVGQSNNGDDITGWGGCFLGTGNLWDEIDICCAPPQSNFNFIVGVGPSGDLVQREVVGDADPHSFSIQSLGPYVEGRIDGMSIGVGTCSTNELVKNLRLGGYQTTPTGKPGGRRVDDGFLNGQIAEVVFYNRAINETERTNLEDYLNTKWGLPVNPSYVPVGA